MGGVAGVARAPVLSFTMDHEEEIKKAEKKAREIFKEDPFSTYKTPVTWMMKGFIISTETHKAEALKIKIDRPDIERMQDYAVMEHLVKRSPEEIGKYVEGSLVVDEDHKRRVPPEGMKLV